MTEQLWERQSKESEEAYHAFLIYRNFGSNRSVDAVVKEYKGSAKKSLSLIYRWSSLHKWVDRARAWDNHLQRERDREAAAYARKMERRRLKQIEDAWVDGESLRSKVSEMLEFPVATEEREESEDGKTIIIRKPARWMMKDIPVFLKTAAELKAAAVAAGSKDPAEMNDAEADATAEEQGEG